MAFEYNITNHNWIPRAPQNCLGSHHGKILLLFQLFVPDPGANSVLPGLTTRVKSIVDGPYCVISPVSVKQTEPCGKTSTIPKKTTWWRHQMEAFSALLAICTGNSPVTGEFRAQRPVTQSFDVFFDLPLNKLLSKQLWGWWFEMPSRPLWRHCNEAWMLCMILGMCGVRSLPAFRNISSSWWPTRQERYQRINLPVI